MTASHCTRLLLAALMAGGLPSHAHAGAPEATPPSPAFVSTLTSQDAAVHLTYASILFYTGLGLLQAGKAEEGKAVFQTVNGELRLALQLSESRRTESDVKLVRSQCAFLLGEVTFNVLNAPASAQAFYEQALREYPEHDGATRALARLLFSNADAQTHTGTKPSPSSH